MKTRVLESGQERLEFFGKDFFMEQNLYIIANKLSQDYQGGFWDLIIAENGAKLVLLDTDKEFTPNTDFFYGYNFKEDEKINSKVFSAWTWLKLLEYYACDENNNINDEIVELFDKAKDCYFDDDKETELLNEDERNQLYRLLD